MRGARSRALAAFLALAAALAAGSVRAEDDPRAAVERDVLRLETAVAVVDKQKAATGTLRERVVSLHSRLGALEIAAGLEAGVLAGKGDEPATLAKDLATIEERWQRVLAARKTPPEKSGAPAPRTPPAPPPPPDPGMATDPAPPAKSPPERAVAWPKRLAFGAFGRVVYTETGKNVSRPTGNGGVTIDLWADGWRGDVHFTLCTKGLLRTVKRAVLKVYVARKEPFEAKPPWRTFDLVWDAIGRGLTSDVSRTWKNQDVWTASAEPHWVHRASFYNHRLDAEAWVQRLVLMDDSSVDFEVPEPGSTSK